MSPELLEQARPHRAVLLDFLLQPGKELPILPRVGPGNEPFQHLDGHDRAGKMIAEKVCNASCAMVMPLNAFRAPERSGLSPPSRLRLQVNTACPSDAPDVPAARLRPGRLRS